MKDNNSRKTYVFQDRFCEYMFWILNSGRLTDYGLYRRTKHDAQFQTQSARHIPVSCSYSDQLGSADETSKGVWWV